MHHTPRNTPDAARPGNLDRHNLELFRALVLRTREIAESRTGWWWSPAESISMAKFLGHCLPAIEAAAAARGPDPAAAAKPEGAEDAPGSR
jgi:hypothetical protein